MTSITFFFLFIPLLAFILLAVNLIFAPHNSYQEKDSAFECGFHSFLGQNRTQFSISFFIFALLFLLFDLEILLVYPYVVSSYSNGIYGLMLMLIFFLALTLGFAFELGKNALKIDSRQMFILRNKNSNITTYLSMNTLLNVITEYHLEILIFILKLFLAFITFSLMALIPYISHMPSLNPIKDGTESFDKMSKRHERRPNWIKDDDEWNEDRYEIIRKVTGQWILNTTENTVKDIYGPYPSPIQLTARQLRWLHEELPTWYPNKYYYGGNKLCIANFQVRAHGNVTSDPEPVLPGLSLITDVGFSRNN